MCPGGPCRGDDHQHRVTLKESEVVFSPETRKESPFKRFSERARTIELSIRFSPYQGNLVPNHVGRKGEQCCGSGCRFQFYGNGLPPSKKNLLGRNRQVYYVEEFQQFHHSVGLHTMSELIDDNGSSQKSRRSKPEKESRPKPPETVLTSLQLIAVAATLGAIVLLVLSLARYDWALPG